MDQEIKEMEKIFSKEFDQLVTHLLNHSLPLSSSENDHPSSHHHRVYGYLDDLMSQRLIILALKWSNGNQSVSNI